MPAIRTLFPAFAAVLCCSLLTACGIHLNDLPSDAPSPLNGNWLLAGQLAPFPQQQPGMSLSSALTVDGTTVYAAGFLQVQCSPTSGFGETFSLQGQLAKDGTFTLTQPSTPDLSTEFISISGSIPAAAGASWSGMYHITPSGSANTANCTLTQAASFQASAIAPLTGTYGGPSTRFPGSPNGLGANVSLALNLNQGAALTGMSSSGSSGIIANGALPLAATLTVIGSSCFTSGTTGSLNGSDFVAGGFFGMTLTMNDGSQMQLTGFLNDLTEDQTTVLYGIKGGNCDKEGGETVLTHS